MKVIFLLLFSLSSFAGELETCQDFVKQVLDPSLVEVLEGDDAGYHFIKDEKKALEFIQKYDPSKLAYSFFINRAKASKNDCKLLMNKNAPDEYCQSEFPNYNFIKALIFGMKNYGWQPSTINLGHQKVKGYLKAFNVEDNFLFQNLIAATVLKIYAAEFPSKVLDPKETLKIKVEADKAYDEYQKRMRTKSNTTCSGFQTSMNEEYAIAHEIQKKLSRIISKL